MAQIKAGHDRAADKFLGILDIYGQIFTIRINTMFHKRLLLIVFCQDIVYIQEIALQLDKCSNPMALNTEIIKAQNSQKYPNIFNDFVDLDGRLSIFVDSNGVTNILFGEPLKAFKMS